MNAQALDLSAQLLPSSKFCEQHKESMVMMGGRDFCKSCVMRVLEQSQKDHAVAVNKMVREKHFEGAKLPARHANSGFRNYLAKNNGQKAAKDACVSLVRDFKNGISRNLIMVGRTGTGKTHLACAVIKNVLETRRFARYVTSEEMAGEIAGAWTKPDDSEASAIWRYTDYDLLVLDEYGLHDRHENRLQLVHKVLYARYDAGKPTMLISNMPLNDTTVNGETVKGLISDLGDRLWSRFQHDGLVVVECNWMDQRVGGVV